MSHLEEIFVVFSTSLTFEKKSDATWKVKVVKSLELPLQSIAKRNFLPMERVHCIRLFDGKIILPENFTRNSNSQMQKKKKKKMSIELNVQTNDIISRTVSQCILFHGDFFRNEYTVKKQELKHWFQVGFPLILIGTHDIKSVRKCFNALPSLLPVSFHVYQFILLPSIIIQNYTWKFQLTNL